MLVILKTLVWISAVSQVLTLDLKHILSDFSKNEYVTFYQNWISTQSPREAADYQTELMERLMNATVDPCDDFYEFACGGYKTMSLVTPVSLYADFAQEKIMLNMMTSEIEASDSDAIRKVKLFYQHCQDNTTWDMAELGKFLESFASWPWLDKKWLETEFDWINVVAKALPYFFDSLFSLRRSDNESALVSFGPPRIVPLTIQEAAHKLSLDMGIRDEDLRDIGDFQREIQRIMDDTGEDYEGVDYSLAELTEQAPHLDFKKLLEALFRSDDVSMASVINLRRPSYFKNLSELIGRTDKRIIANYIFVGLLLIFSSEERGPQDCLWHVYEQSRVVLLDEFQRRYTNYNDIDQIRQIYEGVKEQAMSQDTEFSRKLASAQLVPPDFEDRRNKLAEAYSDLVVDPSSFYTTLLNFRRIMYSFTGVFRRRRTELLETFEWRVVPDIGIIPFITTDFLPPSFHKFGKHFANYAGLGIRLADHMVDVSKRDSPSEVKQIFAYVQSLSLAYRAYKKWLDTLTVNDSTQLKGLALNAYQNFFLATIQRECGQSSHDRIHALYCSEDFKEAFNCPVGSKMSPSLDC